MLLFGLFVQTLGPGMLAHDVATVLAIRPPPTEAVAPVAIANTSRSASHSFRQERERHLLMQEAAKKRATPLLRLDNAVRQSGFNALRASLIASSTRLKGQPNF